MRAISRPWLRTVLAVFGGFAFTIGFCAWLMAMLRWALGMEASEAMLVSIMAAYVVYLIVILWAYVQPRIAVVSFITLGGASGCYSLALLIDNLVQQ